MNRLFKIFFFVIFLVITPLLMLAQTPPDPGGSPGTGGTGTVGSGAPIGDGIFILLTLALAYASRKIYIMRTEKKAEKA